MAIRPSSSMKVNDTPKVLESYDDVEDSIAEMHDELWKVADCIQANEPLQAKQQLEVCKAHWNAVTAFVQALPDPEDEPNVKTAQRQVPDTRAASRPKPKRK